MTQGGKLIEGIFAGETINTPSMLCVEDYLDALAWADSIGGLDALIARADANTALVADWVARTAWVDFLAARSGDALQHLRLPRRSSIRRCAALAAEAQAASPSRLADMLEAEGVAYDIAPHRDAPPGLRIWCGATVEQADLEALLPWLDWAFATAKAGLRKAA